jgi:hypothetical protein
VKLGCRFFLHALDLNLDEAIPLSKSAFHQMKHAVIATLEPRPHDSGTESYCATSQVTQARPTSQDPPLPSCRSAGPIWGPQRVLNIEGEGLAGLSALFILKELMAIVSQLESCSGASSSAASPLYCTGSLKRRGSGSCRSPSTSLFLRNVPCHYFDFICGSSFEGLSAVMLGVMRLTVERAIDRYERILLGINPGISRGPAAFVFLHRKVRNSSSLQQNLREALEESENTTALRGRSAGHRTKRGDRPR